MAEFCDNCGDAIKNKWNGKHVLIGDEKKIYCDKCKNKKLFEDEE